MQSESKFLVLEAEHVFLKVLNWTNDDKQKYVLNVFWSEGDASLLIFVQHEIMKICDDILKYFEQALVFLL